MVRTQESLRVINEESFRSTAAVRGSVGAQKAAAPSLGL